MITINLYDYRQELKRIAIQKQVFTALWVIIFAFAFCGVDFFYEQYRISGLDAEIQEVDAKVKQIDPQVAKIKKMQKRQKRLVQIMDGILDLRSGGVGPTQLLTDIHAAVPDKLWLIRIRQMSWKDIKQRRIPIIFIRDPEKEKKKKKKKKKKGSLEIEKKEFFEIKGRAHSDGAVADFIERLEKIPHFKAVFLHKSKSKKDMKEFYLYCYTGKVDPAV